MRKTRYVVLPVRGISGPAMQASVFKSGSALPRALVGATGTEAGSGLSELIESGDFEILSQRFDDGPAVVRMTPTARLLLEATQPNIQVVPITRYYLPGQGPWAKAASRPAGRSAMDAQGAVFAGDAKECALARAVGGGDGSGVVVGLLDTGVDDTHPALTGAVPLHRCFVPGANASARGPVDWGPNETESAGHGTHVAGIVAARPGFGGPQGVAPGALLHSYRVFPDNPRGRAGAENAVIIESIRTAIDDGCHVVNLSIEGSRLRDAAVRTAISDAWDNGVVCIGAAGNGSGNPVSFPAALPRCVAVTATGEEPHFPQVPDMLQFVSTNRASTNPSVFLAKFSNFGPQVQFTAPGHAIVSTVPGGGWWFNSGTSMAAPFVAGMLARLLSSNPAVRDASPSGNRTTEMLQLLLARAQRLGLPQIYHEGFGLPC